MGEFNEFQEFDEREPIMRLEFEDGEVFEATRANASAKNYNEHLMEFDHIELNCGENEDGDTVIRCLFKEDDSYEKMVEFMATNMYPIFMNLHEVEDYVLDAYIEWCEAQKPEKEEEPLLLPPPKPVEYKPTELSPEELVGLTAVKALYQAEQTRLANLPIDERSVCIRALERAREEWLPYHIEDMRAGHRSMKHRLGAAELLKPIDTLLDQLYKIDHPEEA